MSERPETPPAGTTAPLPAVSQSDPDRSDAGRAGRRPDDHRADDPDDGTLDADTMDLPARDTASPQTTASPETTASPQTTASPETTASPQTTASPEAINSSADSAAPPHGGPSSAAPPVSAPVGTEADRSDPARRGQQIDSDPARRHPYDSYYGAPTQSLPAVDRPGVDRPGVDRPGVDRPGVDRPGVDRPGVDRPGVDRPGVDRPQLDRAAPPPPTAEQHTTDFGTRDPMAYQGSAGVPVRPAPEADERTTQFAPVGAAVPMASARDADAGLDITDDEDDEPLRTRRRGQGFAGFFGVVGLAAAGFGLFGLPLQDRHGEVFYGTLRQLASHQGGLLLRLNASHSTDVGNEFARFAWRIAVPFALGVCGLLLLGVLCWPFMRKAAGVLLGIAALATGVGLVLAAHGTYELGSGSARGTLSLLHWGIGAYVGLAGVACLLVAGVIAGVQSRE